MPRKGENIYKRKDGRWEGRYIKDRTPDGKAIYGYLYAHSYRDLKSKMIATKQKETISEKKETVAPDKTILFGELTDMWLNTAKIKIKDSTYVKYNNLLNAYILPELKDIHIQELSYSRIEEFANKLLTSGGKKKMGLSAKTVNDNISLIRNEHTADSIERHEMELQYVKESSAMLKGIMEMASDKALKKKIEKAYDLLHSSQVKSSGAVRDYEVTVMDLIEVLEQHVARNDVAAANTTLDKIMKNANERNRRLRY